MRESDEMTVMKADDPGWKQAEDISAQIIDFLRGGNWDRNQICEYLES